MALASALRILFERYKLLFTCRPEKQEVGKLVRFSAVGTVDSKLESPAKVLKELLVGGAVVVTHGLKLGCNLLFNAPGNGFQLRVLLQRLAGNIERHIGRVNDAAHKVVAIGQKISAFLLDENVGGIERQTLLVIFAVEVKRHASGNKEQSVIRERTLGMERHRTHRILPVVEGSLVELIVIALFHLTRTLLPDGRHGVQGLKLLVLLILRRIVLACIFRLGKLAALLDHHLNGIAYVV